MPIWIDAASAGTRRLIARRCLGIDTADEHVQWAVAELVGGSEAPSVAILAGLGRPLDRWEIEFYFERGSCGRRELRLPYRYLGADDGVGPNYTGRDAVASVYEREGKPVCAKVPRGGR